MRTRLFVPLLLALLLGACTGVRLMEDRADYEDDIRRLERRLLERPDDPRALRDLGVIYVRTREYGKGQEYLQRAFAREPDDPMTLFYLGLSSEVVARTETAMRFYEKYTEVPRSSPYRRLMQGRYHNLLQASVRAEARSLAERDSATVGAAETSPNIVAVFPLSYQGGDPRFAPLGRGLAEMVTIDLSNLESIRLVERVRRQALRDELELAQSGAVDRSTAPRVGRLLGAGRVVGGSYSVAGRDELHLGAAIARSTGETTGEVSQSGDLDALFDLEKALVFDLIDELDVTLTPAEQEAIETVPTRNLQAFLLYSRALEQEDEGAFGAAAESYRRAARIDPSFSRAVEAAERTESMDVASTTDQVMAAAVETGVAADPAETLMRSRVENLNQSLGSHVVPGTDQRSPAQEVLQELPDPPAPPE
ncbi:MAG TPA: CsgG/HfaB family protein [Rhodothermales bacterium]